MQHYKPTLLSGDTGRGVRMFVKENQSEMWKIFRLYIPFIVGLMLVDALVNELYIKDPDSSFAIGAFIAKYFYVCLAISWHRVVIQGPDNYTMVNPFRPKKHELVFIGMGILLGILFFLLFVALGAGGVFLGAATSPKVVFAIGFVLFVLLVGLSFRLSFYFPAKAVDADITLGKVFALSKGYFWKAFWSSIRALFRLWLLLILLGLVMGLGLYQLGFMETSVNASGETVMHIPVFVEFVLTLPFSLYFEPLFTVIGVSVLSNYYLHSVQNPKNDKV